MADRNNITKVQVGGLMRFIRVGYVNMAEGLLAGEEMTQRLLHHRSLHGWHMTMVWVTVHQVEKSELLAQPAGRSIGWSVSQTAQAAEPLLGS